MRVLLQTSLPFVHPTLAIWAAAAGAVPIVIHLISRRRHRRVDWAAMRFLLAAHRRSARRLRLENLLLLALRVALIVLFGLAVARPFLPAGAWALSGDRHVHRILVWDTSRSMRARVDGSETRFDAASRIGAILASRFPATDPVSLVTTAPPAAVIREPVRDRRLVRQELAAISASRQAGDFPHALSLVGEILEESDAAPGNRAVYLITDLSRPDWASTETDELAPGMEALRRLADGLPRTETSLTIIPVTTSAGNNVCITALDPMASLPVAGQPARARVQIANHSSSPARGLSLQLRRNNEIVREIELPRLAPDSAIETAMSTVFPTPGSHAMEVRVIQSTVDDLDDDDARWLSYDVADAIRVLLIVGQSATESFSPEAGYLAAALSPGAVHRSPVHSAAQMVLPGATPLSTQLISLADLSAMTLRDIDVVVLCNVPRMTPGEWDRVAAFVARGGGLLVTVGDKVSVQNYNEFGYSDGEGVLPAPIDDSVELARLDHPTSFANDDLSHPIVAAFTGHPNSGLFQARVDTYMDAHVEDGRGTVILRYRNGAVAMIERRHGVGRVVLYTTTANMSWTNLPAKGDFVSLAVNTVAHLLPDRGAHRNVTIGQPLVEPLTSVEVSQNLRLVGPDGTVTQPHAESRGTTVVATSGPSDRLGVTRLHVGADERVFCVNVDPRESDLAIVDEPTFRAVLDRPVRFWSTDRAEGILEDGGHSTELASVLLFVVTALLVIESLCALRFGKPRKAEPARHDRPARMTGGVE